MISKLIKVVMLTVLFLTFSTMYTIGADASTKVMWGKTELKKGQIGKVTVLGNASLYQLSDNWQVLSKVRDLKKGEEFRVYSTRDMIADNYQSYYAVGGGFYIKPSDNIKYDTPSKSKLALLGFETNNTKANDQPKLKPNNTKPKEVANTVEKITNGAELARYLGKNYAVLQTNLIKVDFDIVVYENDSLTNHYDYKIELGMDSLKFERAMNAHLSSIKYAETSKTDVELARKQLNDFLEKMAKDVIEKMPNKKFFGQDTYVSYRYPALKMDKLTVKKYSWTNYEPVSMKQIWPGDEPDDYYSVMSVTRDPSSAKVIQYSQDDKARRSFTSEYVTLDYNDFRISEFSWKSYLDETYTSKY